MMVTAFGTVPYKSTMERTLLALSALVVSTTMGSREPLMMATSALSLHASLGNLMLEHECQLFLRQSSGSWIKEQKW